MTSFSHLIHFDRLLLRTVNKKRIIWLHFLTSCIWSLFMYARRSIDESSRKGRREKRQGSEWRIKEQYLLYDHHIRSACNKHTEKAQATTKQQPWALHSEGAAVGRWKQEGVCLCSSLNPFSPIAAIPKLTRQHKLPNSIPHIISRPHSPTGDWFADSPIYWIIELIDWSVDWERASERPVPWVRARHQRKRTMSTSMDWAA